MRLTEAQISKLPRRAQEHINVLEQTIAGLARELRQFQGAEESAITIRKSLEFVPVPEGTVRFALGTNQFVDIRIDGAGLDVMAYPNRIYVAPFAANHIRLTLD